MKALLKTVFEGKTLAREEATLAMRLILDGEARTEQVAAFLAALQVRGESREELAGFLQELGSRAVPVQVKRRDLFDTCGTGGDGAGTFNISTATAFVVAGAGVGVAKHGNRSVSSRAGSADVLEALGVKIDLPASVTARAIDTFGFGFLFAPLYHPALAKVGPLRRALEVRTVFNVLGPLANPARVRRQILGVYDARFLASFAELLRDTGTEEAMVVSGEDGLDELTLSAATRVAHLKNSEIRHLRLTPEDFGLARAPREALRGADAATNARLVEGILTGEVVGPKRDVVLMNAAAALVVAGKTDDLREGVRLAEASIANGAARSVLEQAREVPCG